MKIERERERVRERVEGEMKRWINDLPWRKSNINHN